MAKRIHVANRQDVAARAGVAPSTVSLVLNNTPGPRIPEETRARVIAAAKELSYQSNSIARALVTGKTNTIGVVMGLMDQPFHSYMAAVLDGFWSGVLTWGYRMLMVKSTTASSMAGLYRERSVDGALVFAATTGIDDDELRSMAQAGFPTVFVGTQPTAIRGKLDYVDIDNVATAQQATERLIAAGHRNILHIAGPLDVNSAAVDRLKGYTKALKAAGIPFRSKLVIDCSFNRIFAEERLSAALDEGLTFTAIFAANHAMAQGAIRALSAHGLAVPGKVSVIAIDADPNRESASFHVTTFAQPLHQIGAEAVKLLHGRIKGTITGPGTHIQLPCTLIEGDTVRAL